jgi:hypothetical protein
VSKTGFPPEFRKLYPELMNGLNEFNAKLRACAIDPESSNVFVNLSDFLFAYFNIGRATFLSMTLDRIEPFLDRWIHEHGGVREREDPNPAVNPIPFEGDIAEFRWWINEMFDRGYIPARNITHALALACQHYLQKNGKPMNYQSVLNTLPKKPRAKREKNPWTI